LTNFLIGLFFILFFILLIFVNTLMIVISTLCKIFDFVNNLSIINFINFVKIAHNNLVVRLRFMQFSFNRFSIE
jgi:hypothetical protein